MKRIAFLMMALALTLVATACKVTVTTTPTYGKSYLYVRWYGDTLNGYDPISWSGDNIAIPSSTSITVTNLFNNYNVTSVQTEEGAFTFTYRDYLSHLYSVPYTIPVNTSSTDKYYVLYLDGSNSQLYTYGSQPTLKTGSVVRQ